ncbi:MAG TPA: DUF1175 family protein [Pyrinomonadaceae bacterium]|nr:DUF1175 family protein [Pyrinomonadaceae bacterium]
MLAPRKMSHRRLVLLLASLLLVVPVVFSLTHLAFLSSTPATRLKPEGKPENNRLTRSEVPPDADLDHDGIPDVAELRSFNDRDNFRRWFTWIAEMQFYKLSDEWNSEQRDCAGLVRFAWRESLRKHDRAWYQRMGENYDPVAPDVSIDLASEPLREKLFRAMPGNYSPRDVAEGKFSEFADAQTLKMFNATFVGRDRQQAQPGDLLFFHQPWVQKFPYHVMIFLGEPRLASENAHDWVVYHTGASPQDAGEVKKVRLSVLDQHPNKRWRPLPGNPNFLGFFRLKIFNQQVTE